MAIEVYEDGKAAEKLDAYRQIKSENCFLADTDLGPVIMVFDCPGVRGLGSDTRYSFLPTAALPVPLTLPLLLLDIEVYGGQLIKVAFKWETGVPENMLTAKYLALFAAKRPQDLWVRLNKKRRITDRDIRRFARSGSLDINLEKTRQNLESVILPFQYLIDPTTSKERMVNN